jgi:hypothetical protein
MAFMGSLPNSGPVAALEAERQQFIVMNAASNAFVVAAPPATVDPASVIAAASGGGLPSVHAGRQRPASARA